MPPDFAPIFNAIAIGLVVLYSWFVAARHGAAYFSHWTRAYTFGLLVMVVNLITPAPDAPSALTVIQGALFFASAWHFGQTAAHLQDKTLPERLFGAGLALVAAGATATIFWSASTATRSVMA